MKNKKKANITNQNGKPKPKMLGKENRYMHLLKVGIIILLGIIIYSNSFNCSFQLDDPASIVDNQVIRDVTNVNSIWKYSQSRFIPYFSLAVNYHFGELNVWGYHFLNLIIHLINASLVYWLTLLIFSAPALKSYAITKDKNTIALITALLFISHPLATQSVTYIVQRMASLVAMFYFLSLVLYMKGRLIEKMNQTKYLFFAGSIFAAILALLSKENAFTLPFAIVLFEIMFFQTRKLSINIKDYRVLTVIAMLLVFIFVIISNFPLTSIFKTHPPNEHNNFTNITPINYLFTQFSVIIKYIQLLLLPINQNVDHDFPISKSFFELRTILSFLCLLFLVTFAFLKYKKNRIITFGILWFFLTLSIESSIIPIDDVIFEHRTYLPSFGFFIILSSSVYILLWNKNKKLALAILGLIIVSNAIFTYERNKIWKDEFSLWNDCVSKSPNKARPYNNRGNSYFDSKKMNDKALADFNKAIELIPQYTRAYYNRGNLFKSEKRFEKAMKDYNKAIALNSKFFRAYNNRGTIFIKEKNFNRALEDYNKAIKIHPNYCEALSNRGEVYILTQKYSKAVQDLNKAIKLQPDYGIAYVNRGSAQLKLGNIEQCCLDYKRAMELGFNQVESVYIENCQ